MSKRILVVDDSATMRQMIRHTLREGGYQVSEAADGEQALAALASEKFTLVLTDLTMPVMDGLELLRRIRGREECRFLPVVLLTTDGQEERKEEGRQAGATAWIVKPFEPQTLLAVMRQVLG